MNEEPTTEELSALLAQSTLKLMDLTKAHNRLTEAHDRLVDLFYEAVEELKKLPCQVKELTP
jgi:hypothetical protein